MRTIWVELGTDCGRCGGKLAVNGLVGALPCARCGYEAALAPEVTIAQLVEGREGIVGAFGAGGSVTGRFGPADDGPRCARCDAPLDMRRAFGEGAGTAPCTRCRERAGMRPVPEALAERAPKGATHLVGEELAPAAAPPKPRRFYVWSDAEERARAAAEARARRRRIAPLWLGAGAVLAGVGGYFLYARGWTPWAGAMTAVGAGLFLFGLARFTSR